MKHVYVKPEEKNYKHILCKEKIQQWKQFQQIKQRCLGHRTKVTMKHSTPAVQGVPFYCNTTPHGNTSHEINSILKKSKQNQQNTRVGGE